MSADLNSGTFIVKIAARCNLNCTYCYVYNLGDTTFRLRPGVMSRQVAQAALKRIIGYATRHDMSKLALVLHGGEPLLVGKVWMTWFLEEANRLTPPGLRMTFSLQTNGTLLDRDWLSLLARHRVSLGISIDGPSDWHDRHRIDFRGRGSYALVRRGLERVLEAGSAAPRWGVLTVANPAYSGVAIYKHLLEIGVRNMDFLWPDFHHDMLPPWPAGSLTQYYNEIFDAWYQAGDSKVSIRWFETVIEMLLGAQSRIDALGPHPLAEVVVETDGSLEPLDVLRTCGNGMTRLGLNVLANDIEDLRATELFQLCLRNQNLLPEECHHCPVYSVCGGGYLPHRWGNSRGFRNPSVHSAELRSVIMHVQEVIRADLEEVGIKQQLVTEAS
jgi:uncharacterized protein